MSTRVLVTGAGGFIGSHLVEALVQRGVSVRALVRYNGRGDLGALGWVPPSVRERIEVVAGDITDPHFVRSTVEGCETVFHLAALIAIPYSYLAAHHVFETNVLGTLHVATACVATGAKMVHTSSSEVYGTAQTIPIREDHPLVGQSPYAASKIGADQAVLSFHRSHGLCAIVVRPFNTYGPRQSGRAIVTTIATQALTSDVCKLGSLSPTRDLTYVTDTAAGILAAGDALPRAAGQVVQLGTGHEIAVVDLAAKIIAMTGRSVHVVSDATRVRPAASEVDRLLSDPSRAKAVLGWSARVSLDDGLAHTLAYVQDHLERFRPGEYQR